MDGIKIATVSKEPTLDFSLCDYVFTENSDAEKLINRAYFQQEFKTGTSY